MNANELAILLDKLNEEEYRSGVIEETITMLRQQHAEIEALKKQLEDAKDEMAMWQMSYENCHRMCSGYGMN